MANFVTNDRLMCKITQVCMNFGGELRKRKIQVTQFLAYLFNPMNRRTENIGAALQHFRKREMYKWDRLHPPGEVNNC